jgi:ferritin
MTIFLVITTVAAILIALRQTVIAQKQTEIAQKATEKLDEQQREVTDWLVKTGHSELSRLRHIVQKRE